MTIEKNMYKVLEALVKKPREEGGYPYVSNEELHKLTGLTADELNDAVTMLVDSGYLEWLRTMGTAPYNFRDVALTALGRYEYEKTLKVSESKEEEPTKIIQHPTPIGSPYGFTDQDWEALAEAKGNTATLFVVFGHAFKSEKYNTEELKKNIEAIFIKATSEYNKRKGVIPVILSFKPLVAGYGEHLFNEIARDIIASDIAVFDTSDLNPNVMLEMGVALTWGVRVLPVKERECQKPPSDISGQTWADYINSGAEFIDTDNIDKIVRMIERAMRKK